ncbi:hypothetical protein K440DRAFT_625715 [Wilcoxina mikolae CBS 423.85]|nr:hypothetical protein K440DRAFT_625715 [Wilcoxina mikolae CBS 423.85]
MLGPNEENLARDLERWIRDIELQEVSANQRDRGRFLVGFSGLSPESPDATSFRPPSLGSDPSPSELQTHALGVISELPLEILLAQHMFSAFMWAIAEHVPDNLICTNKITTKRDGPSLSPKPENSVILQLANAIQSAGLAKTPEEAYMCIIPPLSCAKKLPDIDEPYT